MTTKQIFIGTLLLTIFASVFYVRSRFIVVELSYEIDKIRKENIDLERNKNMLVLELEVLKNPKRIEKYVKENLDLDYNPSGNIIVMKEDR